MTTRPAVVSLCRSSRCVLHAPRGAARRGQVLVELLISLVLLAVASVALSRVLTSAAQQADRLTLVRVGTALVHNAAEALALEPCITPAASGPLGRVALTPTTDARGPLRVQRFDVTLRASEAFDGRTRAVQADAAGWCP